MIEAPDEFVIYIFLRHCYQNIFSAQYPIICIMCKHNKRFAYKPPWKSYIAVNALECLAVQ